MRCPFCDRIRDLHYIAENGAAVAFRDGYPLSPGHCLIVPRRHEADYLSLGPDEQSAMWALIPAVRRLLEAEYHPHGYNIGINIGDAAGQTIAHAHLHVIPRYTGDDVPDPRGGIRAVLPAKARYWEEA